MILISHRGNIDGKNSDYENNPEYIIAAIDKGYDCEVDVWCYDNLFFLGHDGPNHKVDEKFLENNKLWVHAKNIIALSYLIKNEKIHCFFHNTDGAVLTSKKFLWTFPEQPLYDNSICVLPKKKPELCAGICSDYISSFS